MQVFRNYKLYLLSLVACISSFSWAFFKVLKTRQPHIGALSRSLLNNFDLHECNESEKYKEIISNPMVKQKRIRPRIPILQYHDDWVAVNKPAGMTVHRSTSTPRSQLVLSTLLKRQLARKVFPVHRLDHRTSGAILFAFNSKTCGLLHKALTCNGMIDDDEMVDDLSENTESFSQGSKQYLALLRGDWRRKYGEKKSITVTKPLSVKGIQKESETTFTLLSSYTYDKQVEHCPSACSLVLCSPKTGRFHQIRRHAQSISFPVIGDTKYGDTKVNRYFREKRGVDRLFLHCLSLSLPPLSAFDPYAPGSNELINVIAPLPSELRSVLQREDMSALWDEAVQYEPRLAQDDLDERGGTFGRNYRTKSEKGKNLGHSNSDTFYFSS